MIRIPKLKKCPFCGEAPEVEEEYSSNRSNARGHFRISCVNYVECLVLPDVRVSWTKSDGVPEGAIQDSYRCWNRRLKG